MLQKSRSNQYCYKKDFGLEKNKIIRKNFKRPIDKCKSLLLFLKKFRISVEEGFDFLFPFKQSLTLSKFWRELYSLHKF